MPDTMKAGRDLDALIYRRLFESKGGEAHCPSCGGCHFGSSGENFDTIDCHDQYGVGCSWRGPRAVFFRAPEYSTEIEAAFEVVAAVEKRFSCDWDISGSPGHVQVDFRVGSAGADTVPLAICLAALDALGPET